ncbi:MAG: hypothetical protein PHW03_09800 [Eubacteriales bacterium]|nr:hypothetical protein [Eubacteriales bacterium]
MTEVSQSLINGFAGIVSFVVGLLPSSPFAAYMAVSLSSDVLRAINWFIPVGQIISVTAAWLLCVAGWYVYQLILRWAKAIA